MKNETRGGKRAGAGRKGRFVSGIQVKLAADELAVYEKYGSSPAFVRFLIRKQGGLCTHGIHSLNTATGLHTCELCGVENPENFGIFHAQNLEMLDDDNPF